MARTVMFRLDLSCVEAVTNDETNHIMSWDGKPEIRTVAVAGGFNRWNRSAWQMESKGDGVFELRKSFDEVGGPGVHLFKFIADGFTWIEPPSGAVNRKLVGNAKGSSNVVLEIA